jgi:DNA polymerase III delta prime subunit
LIENAGIRYKLFSYTNNCGEISIVYGGPTRRSLVEMDGYKGLATQSYAADDSLGKPLLIEGEAGVGKTEAAKALASLLYCDLIRLQLYEGLDAHHASYVHFVDVACNTTSIILMQNESWLSV